MTKDPAPFPARRSFLKQAATVVVGGLITVIPGLAGLAVYFDPERRRRVAVNGAAAEAGFIDVAPLRSLPPDGVPRRFQVIAERVDAWTKHPASPIGAVFLKRPKESPETIVAFNVVCPHAGCSVEVANGTHGGFRCPCHNSSFHPDGSIVKGQCVSPRGLDTLEVDPASVAHGVVRVRFQNFVAGTHEKTPTA